NSAGSANGTTGNSTKAGSTGSTNSAGSANGTTGNSTKVGSTGCTNSAGSANATTGNSTNEGSTGSTSSAGSTGGTTGNPTSAGVTGGAKPTARDRARNARARSFCARSVEFGLSSVGRDSRAFLRCARLARGGHTSFQPKPRPNLPHLYGDEPTPNSI